MELRLRSLDGGFLWLTSVCCGPTHSFLASRAQTDVSRCSRVSWRVAAPRHRGLVGEAFPWALDEETSERPSAAKRLCERCGGTVRDGLADLFPVVRCHCPSLATWSPAQSVCRERQPETIQSREKCEGSHTQSKASGARGSFATGGVVGPGQCPPPPFWTVPWLILPVVICLSQRLSHACLSASRTRSRV